jgi:large repetitive protein
VTRLRTARRATKIVTLLGVLLVAAGFAAIALGASAPPTPSLSANPNTSPTNSATETFTFSSSGATSYLCSLNGAAFSTCTSPKTYGSTTAPLANGPYSFKVEASDKNGHLSSPASYSWVVDRTPPPAPSITAKPPSSTSATSASFSFSDSEAGVSFLCKLDAAAYALCASPTSYAGLALGSHTFSVEAKDAATNLSTASSYTWQVVPPTPTITAKPANATNQTTASFSFTDTLAGVSFECALDTSTFSGCTSPQSYPGLTQGAHTFQVRAVSGSNKSAPASYTWTVDTTPPPTPSIIYKPASLSNTTSPTFAFSDSEAGVSYLCKLDGGSFLTCSNPVTYSGLAQGNHTFAVEAQDVAGNTSTPTAAYTWTIDSIPPPLPVLTYMPDDPNGDGIANFDWTDSEAGTTFLCSIENGKFTTCPSGSGHLARYIVDVSNDGTHQFAVRAYDAAGNFAETDYSWKVLHAVNVVVDGNAVGLLYPGGPTRTIPLTLHNPNNFPVTISYIKVALKSSPPGCNGSDLDIQQSNVGNGPNPVTVTVPANNDLTLPSGGATRPTVRLLDNGNQDACKDGAFILSYLATGSK